MQNKSIKDLGKAKDELSHTKNKNKNFKFLNGRYENKAYFNIPFLFRPSLVNSKVKSIYGNNDFFKGQ